MRSNRWTRRTTRTTQANPHDVRPMAVELLEDRCTPSVGATDFRTADASSNNEADPTLGTADTALLRLSPEAYRTAANDPNGFFTPSMNGGAPFFVAGSRLVSNVISDQATELFGSEDINTVNQNGLSNFGYTWGQFLDHDMGLTPDTPVNDFPIPADPTNPDDPIGSLRMGRSVFDPTTGTTSPREQINVNTSFLDLSQVYGSTQSVADALRTFAGGLLKASGGADGTPGTGDDLLPFNNTAYFTTAELALLKMANDAHVVQNDELFAAGDVRANETTELTALHTLFLRNHNRIAGVLAAAHPDWTDEHLYQTARKINIAQYQIITYEGYLPALLGPTALAGYAGYDPDVDPRISNEFSTVAFRFGHSLLNNTVPRHADDGSSVGDLTLLESFFNPRYLTPGQTGYTDIGAVLKGDADNNAQAMDTLGVSSIRNMLFGNSGIGEDLIARDLWRAHDHGIGTYNDLRVAFGLDPVTNTGGTTHGFEQITSDTDVQALLLRAYTGPTREAFLANGKFAGDIDPFAAGMAEDHVPGSDLGPLFHTILVEQFTRLRDGDRFFYLNYEFTSEELALIGSGNTLAKVIKTNTGITSLQDDVFRFLAQQDGKGKGYYTNKSGQAELTGSQSGTTVSDAVYNALVAAFGRPGDPTHLVLVDAGGNYLSADFLRSYSNLKSYLANSSGSMAFKLSLQLLTTELNVILGKVDSTTSIHVPSITGNALTAAQQTALQTNGVSDPSGVANVQDLIAAAIALLDNGTTDATFAEALKNCFEGINSNQSIFILN